MTEHLAALASSFLRHLRAEGKSERTAVIYGTSIRLFSDWIVARSRPATLDQLSRSEIREWLAELVDAGLAPGTVRTRYKGSHRFCRWPAHPMAELAVLVVPDKPVPLLSDDDLTALVKACAGRRWQDRRDEAASASCWTLAYRCRSWPG